MEALRYLARRPLEEDVGGIMWVELPSTKEHNQFPVEEYEGVMWEGGRNGRCADMCNLGGITIEEITSTLRNIAGRV